MPGTEVTTAPPVSLSASGTSQFTPLLLASSPQSPSSVLLQTLLEPRPSLEPPLQGRVWSHRSAGPGAAGRGLTRGGRGQGTGRGERLWPCWAPRAPVCLEDGLVGRTAWNAVWDQIGRAGTGKPLLVLRVPGSHGWCWGEGERRAGCPQLRREAGCPTLLLGALGSACRLSAPPPALP